MNNNYIIAIVLSILGLVLIFAVEKPPAFASQWSIEKFYLKNKKVTLAVGVVLLLLSVVFVTRSYHKLF